MDLEHKNQLKQQIIENGYCHLPGIVSDGLIQKLRQVSDRAAEDLSDHLKKKFRFQGSMISIWGYSEMASLIALPKAIEALRELGYPRPKFYSGYIISKPPEKAPALFWHQDCILWDEAISYTNIPHQFFLMYYLIDTNPQNGCLRVIPGSHLSRHRLHCLLPAHSEDLQKVNDNHPALQKDPDEVDVPVKAGDLIIGDSRILHSAHPNCSGHRRTVVTLWFLPTYDHFPKTLKNRYGKPQEKPVNWSDRDWALVKPFLIGPLLDSQSRNPDDRLI